MGLHIYHFSAPRVCKMGTSSNLPHQFKGLRSSMPSALKKTALTVKWRGSLLVRDPLSSALSVGSSAPSSGQHHPGDRVGPLSCGDPVPTGDTALHLSDEQLHLNPNCDLEVQVILQRPRGRRLLPRQCGEPDKCPAGSWQPWLQPLCGVPGQCAHCQGGGHQAGQCRDPWRLLPGQEDHHHRKYVGAGLEEARWGGGACERV